jgi:hypothetical protein
MNYIEDGINQANSYPIADERFAAAISPRELLETNNLNP